MTIQEMKNIRANKLAQFLKLEEEIDALAILIEQKQWEESHQKLEHTH